MASTYVNNLRLEEIGTGEQSGTWGDTTNTNLELIGQATAWGTRAIANASTDNITIADGAADADRCLGLKLTGGGQACTVTLLPNTSSKTWFMYNATAADLTFTCGSGANVVIPAGQTKVIATDGLGSGGVVHDLLTAVNLAGTTVVDDLTVSDDLTVTDDMTVGGTLGVTGVLTATSLDISGDIDVDGTTNLDAVDIDGAVQLDSTLTVGVDDTGYDVKFFGATSGRYMEFDASEDRLFLRDNTKLVFGNGTDFEIYSGGTGAKLHANNGVLELEGDSVQIWNAGANEAQAKFTADGEVQLYFNGVEKFNTQDAGVVIHGTIANEGATDFTIDVSQDLIFDSGHGDFYFKDTGTSFLNIYESSSNAYILTPINNQDLILQGIDGGAGVDALRLDMGNAGEATFNAAIKIKGPNVAHPGLAAIVLGQDDSATSQIRLYGTNDSTLGTLKVEATTSAGSTTKTLLTMAEGSADFNPGAINMDFRVRSDGNDNMLIVDGAENAVAVGGTTVDRGIFHVNHVNNGNFFDDPHIALTFNASPTDNASSSGITYATSDSDNYGYFLGAQRTNGGAGNFILKYHADSAGGTHEVFRADASGNFGIGSLIPSSTYKFIVQNSTNQISQLNYNSNASFTQDLHAWDTIRAGTSAFNFGRWRSNVGGSPDSEFIFNGAGTATADGAWNGGGADYAEYFEWADGNPSSQDRVGVSVKLDGTKIVASTSSDDPSEIIGVISANPSVVGDTAGLKWQSKYEKDDYNRYIWEAYTFTEWTVPATETKEAVRHIYPTDYIPSDVTVPSDAVVISKDDDGNNLMRKKLNSSFDKSIIYVPRSDRKEWDTVGLMGKLRMTKGQKTGTNWIKMKDISDTVEEWLVR